MFSLTEVAKFLQCTLDCLMSLSTVPAAFVNLDPLFKLVIGEFGNITALTEILYGPLTVGTVSFSLDLLLL